MELGCKPSAVLPGLLRASLQRQQCAFSPLECIACYTNGMLRGITLLPAPAAAAHNPPCLDHATNPAGRVAQHARAHPGCSGTPFPLCLSAVPRAVPLSAGWKLSLTRKWSGWAAATRPGPSSCWTPCAHSSQSSICSCRAANGAQRGGGGSPAGGGWVEDDWVASFACLALLPIPLRRAGTSRRCGNGRCASRSGCSSPTDPCDGPAGE
jgi:hypothetical protein